MISWLIAALSVSSSTNHDAIFTQSVVAASVQPFTAFERVSFSVSAAKLFF
jgi:hypothetical protein